MVTHKNQNQRQTERAVRFKTIIYLKLRRAAAALRGRGRGRWWRRGWRRRGRGGCRGRGGAAAARPGCPGSPPAGPATRTPAQAHPHTPAHKYFYDVNYFLREFRVRCRVQDLSSTGVTSVSGSLHTAMVARREAASSQQEVRARRARSSHSWYLRTHHQHTCCQSRQHRPYRLENMRIYLFL